MDIEEIELVCNDRTGPGKNVRVVKIASDKSAERVDSRNSDEDDVVRRKSKMPQRRDNAGAVYNSGMGMLFLYIYF